MDQKLHVAIEGKQRVFVEGMKWSEKKPVFKNLSFMAWSSSCLGYPNRSDRRWVNWPAERRSSIRSPASPAAARALQAAKTPPPRRRAA
jgi:hypothetical protein